MKKRVIFSAIFCGISLAFFAQNVQIPSPKIGFIDRNFLIDSLAKTFGVENYLEKLNAEFEKEFSRQSQEYNAKVKNYLEKNQTLSREIKLVRQAEITEAEKRISLFKERYTARLKTERDSLMQPIFSRVDSMIKVSAQEEKLSLVIEKQNALFLAPDCLDLLEIVKMKLK